MSARSFLRVRDRQIALRAVVICLVSEAFSGHALLLQPWFNEAHAMVWSTCFSLLALSDPQSTVALQFIVILSARTLSIELCFYLVAPFIVRRHLLLIAAIAYASHYPRF